MSLLPLVLALGAMGATNETRDPLEGNNGDWLICTHPNDTEKTCDSLTVFSRNSDGNYSEVDRSIVRGLPGLVLEVRTTAFVRAGMICGIARRSEYLNAQIVNHVAGVSRQREAEAIRHIAFAYPVEGKEVCAALVPDGGQFIGEVWIDGVRLPQFDTRVRWVHKDDGYTVAGWQTLRTESLR
jgi:hypothetical protein